jgi:hypothetical protein
LSVECTNERIVGIVRQLILLKLAQEVHRGGKVASCDPSVIRYLLQDRGGKRYLSGDSQPAIHQLLRRAVVCLAPAQVGKDDVGVKRKLVPA